jgi:hypothetical protein
MKRNLNTLQDIQRERIRLKKLIQLDQEALKLQILQTSEQAPNQLFRRWLLPLGIGSLLTVGAKQLNKLSAASMSSQEQTTWQSWILSTISPFLQQWINEQISRWLPFTDESYEDD